VAVSGLIVAACLVTMIVVVALNAHWREQAEREYMRGYLAGAAAMRLRFHRRYGKEVRDDASTVAGDRVAGMPSPRVRVLSGDPSAAGRQRGVLRDSAPGDVGSTE
jgi:hypothetical protein